MNLIKIFKFGSNLLKYSESRHRLRVQSKCLTTMSSNVVKAQNVVKSAQNLIIDLSFEDQMTTEECHRLARDLYAIHCINCSLEDIETKFNVNICSQMSKNSITIEYLRQYLPQMHSNDNFHIHNKSYLDLFDRQRLVYLSPDAKQVIQFDSNDVYIIGGIVKKHVFKRCSNRLSHSKAKDERVRIGRFPIDPYINDEMKRGIVLFLPQVFGILCDVKATQDWESAVRRHLPFWKLTTTTVTVPHRTYQCQ